MKAPTYKILRAPVERLIPRIMCGKYIYRNICYTKRCIRFFFCAFGAIKQEEELFETILLEKPRLPNIRGRATARRRRLKLQRANRLWDPSTPRNYPICNRKLLRSVSTIACIGSDQVFHRVCTKSNQENTSSKSDIKKSSLKKCDPFMFLP